MIETRIDRYQRIVRARITELDEIKASPDAAGSTLAFFADIRRICNEELLAVLQEVEREQSL